MTDLRVKIVPDVSSLKKEIKSSVKEGFGGSSGSSGSFGGVDTGGRSKGKKENKKQSGLLSGILGKLAIVAGLIAALKPIQDILKITLNFITLFTLKFLKWLGVFDKKSDEEKTETRKVSDGIRSLVSGSIPGLSNSIAGLLSVNSENGNSLEDIDKGNKQIRDSVVNWLGRVGDSVKTIPTKIKEFFISLGGEINELGTRIGDFFQGLWNGLKEKFQTFIIKVGEIITKIVGLPSLIKEKIKTLWDSTNKFLGEKLDKVKEFLEPIKDFLKNIWDGIKSLASSIASKIRGAIDSINPFSRGKSDSVNDAIIKPNGQVIKTDPMDTLIASKNPSGMGGGQKTFNFYGVTPEEMVKTIKEEMRDDLINRSRF